MFFFSFFIHCKLQNGLPTITLGTTQQCLHLIGQIPFTVSHTSFSVATVTAIITAVVVRYTV